MNQCLKELIGCSIGQILRTERDDILKGRRFNQRLHAFFPVEFILIVFWNVKCR